MKDIEVIVVGSGNRARRMQEACKGAGWMCRSWESGIDLHRGPANTVVFFTGTPEEFPEILEFCGSRKVILIQYAVSLNLQRSETFEFAVIQPLNLINMIQLVSVALSSWQWLVHRLYTEAELFREYEASSQPVPARI